jgi:hypothetical protein
LISLFSTDRIEIKPLIYTHVKIILFVVNPYHAKKSIKLKFQF